MIKFDDSSKVEILNISLKEIFNFPALNFPLNKELLDIVKSYEAKSIKSFSFVEYSYIECSVKYRYLYKLLILNENNIYSQVTFLFWHAGGGRIDKEIKGNIIDVDSIWESEIEFSNISEKTKKKNHINYRNQYLQDTEFVNHRDNFFYFPVINQDIFVKYHKLIGKCNIKSMLKYYVEFGKHDNFIKTLEITDWLIYDFNQIYLHDGGIIGSIYNKLIVELPASELFKNRHLFSDIMVTDEVDGKSRGGNLSDYVISINRGFLIITHTYDYYQGDNPRDYKIIDKIALIDLMNFKKDQEI